MSAKDKLNSRQRLFCVNLASGMSQSQAYLAAGYSSVQPGADASHLLADNPNVKPYLDQLIERKNNIALAKVAESVLSANEKRTILAEIARAQLVDFQDDNGEPKLDRNTPQGRAAREYYHRKRTVGRGKDKQEIITKSIKLLDPIAAIQEDNKMAGHYAPSKHLVANYNVSVSLKPKSRHQEDDGDTITEG